VLEEGTWEQLINRRGAFHTLATQQNAHQS